MTQFRVLQDVTNCHLFFTIFNKIKQIVLKIFMVNDKVSKIQPSNFFNVRIFHFDFS